MTGRDLPFDAFRGLTVLLMVMVNLQVPGHAPAWIAHAEWDGLTLADLVFPWFLLIVGLSIPLAIDGRPARVGKIARRSALLFAIGVALALMIRPRFEPEQIRWMGVLQRIAIVYFACAMVALATRGWRAPALAAAACLTLHTVLLLTPPPGGAPPGLAPGEGMAGWLDRLLLPGRVFRNTWDPEGVLSTLSAIGSGLIGVATMRWLRGGGDRLGAVAAGLTAAGLAVAMLVPINKALWTASFALVTAGLGLALWIAIRTGWRRIAHSVAGRWLVLAGQTALTLYIVHTLLIVVLVRKLADGRSIWLTAHDALVAIGIPTWAGSLLFATLASAVSLAVMPALQRRGWVLRL